MKNTSTFNNLWVMALVDGELDLNERTYIDSLSYGLAITDEEYNYCDINKNSLTFIVPDNLNDTYDDMYYMVMVAMSSNGVLAEAEITAIYNFGRDAGIEADFCASIINKFEEEYFNKLDETILFNKTEYDSVLMTLQKSGKTDRELIDMFIKVSKSNSLNETEHLAVDTNTIRAMYAWLYIVYYRYVTLVGEAGLTTVLTKLNLLENEQETLVEFFEFLKTIEDNTSEIYKYNVSNCALVFLQGRLTTVFPFN